MAELTVGAGGQYGKLSQAAAAAKPGDRVTVYDGIFNEQLSCDVEGVEWLSEGAIIDGGWDGGAVSELHNQVSIPANGVVFSGFTVRNSPGRAIGTSANNVKILNNKIDNCANTGIAANGSGKGLSNLLVSGNVMTRLGMGRLVGGRAGAGMTYVRCFDSVVENNSVSGGHGEGIDIDKGSYRIKVRKNVFHTFAHVHIYFNRCVDCEASDNLIYHTMDEDYHHRDGWPAAIVFGDERSGGSGFPWQSGNKVFDNVVVNMGKLFQVRNNDSTQAGYDTQLSGHVVANNTFIGGPATEAGWEIKENMRGRPHENSRFEGNVILSLAPSSCNSRGVSFARNAWAELPSGLLAGVGDIQIGVTALVNPMAKIVGDYTGSDIDIDNYRPTQDSPLLVGSEIIGALAPIGGPVTPPDEDAAMIQDIETAISLLNGVLDRLKA